MKKYICFSIVIIVMTTLGVSCSKKKKVAKGLTLNDYPIVAHQEYTNGDTLTVCDFASVKDTFNIPLSAFLSSFEIVQLENTEEALTAEDGVVTVSDNYIGVYSFKAGAYKLYTKEGEYLHTISSSGQGPNEYNIGIYDSYIDEKNGKIYLLSGRASKILVFNLEGKPLQHIPLPYITHKGRFIIYPETKILTMLALPFNDNLTPSAIWEQDFKGNLLQEIPSNNFIVRADYDNEIQESLNTDKIDYSLLNFDPRLDTLFHYERENNELTPAFTIHFEGEILRHYYVELADYYLITLYYDWSYMMEANLSRYPTILVDKKTLRGCYANIKMGMLGGIDGPDRFSFSRGYLTGNIEPYKLKEQLEETLSQSDKLAPEMRQKLKTLNKNITDDDNNILFIGKLKTR